LPVCTKVRTTVRLVLPLPPSLGDEIDGVAIELVVDRGSGTVTTGGVAAPRSWLRTCRLRMRSGLAIVAWHANVARVGGDLRLDGRDLAFELAARIGVDAIRTTCPP